MEGKKSKKSRVKWQELKIRFSPDHFFLVQIPYHGIFFNSFCISLFLFHFY